MKLHLPLFAALLCSSAVALCQSSTFDLIVANKPVGKSVYTLAKQKNGYKLQSRQTFRMGPRDGDQSSEFKFGETYKYLDGSTTDRNSQLMTSYIPMKGGGLTISHYQGGGHDSTPVTAGENLIVLPPLDAGAAQAALLYVLANPRPDNIYSMIIAGGSGGGGGGGRGGDAPPDPAAAAAANSVPVGKNGFDVIFLKGKETSGMLDGKPVVLHAYLLGVGKFRLAFYADEQNQLMEFRAPAFQASYVRQGFKLDAPPPSAAKPPAL